MDHYGPDCPQSQSQLEKGNSGRARRGDGGPLFEDEMWTRPRQLVCKAACARLFRSSVRTPTRC